MAIGRKTGGRKKGTPNKRTQGRQVAEVAAKAEMVTPPAFDPLDHLEKIAMTFVSMAAKEQQKDKPDQKWLAQLLECSVRTLKEITPYRHRRLGQLGIDVEALMQRDGTLRVSISSGDSDL